MLRLVKQEDIFLMKIEENNLNKITSFVFGFYDGDNQIGTHPELPTSQPKTSSRRILKLLSLQREDLV